MAQISKELLEKYELGQCTDQEEKLVLDWLDNDDWDDLSTKEAEKSITNEEGVELWNKLETYIQKEEPKKNLFFTKSVLSIAASIIFLVMGSIALLPYLTNQEVSDRQLGHVETVTYPFTLILGKDSQAHIDIQTGKVTLTGEILFTPSQDLVLQHGSQSNLFFKAGETYYLSESKDPEKIIIIKKDDFTFLPAIVQKQIRKQFQIS